MKKRNILVTIFALLGFLSLGAVSLAGCGGGGGEPAPQVETFKITWSVPTQATVKAEGYEELPASAEASSSISFTVTVAEGYSLDAVRANNKKLSLKNEKYTVAITRDTEIVIEVSEAIGELKVETKPTKLTYVSGDTLDLTGMVVTVTYGTGRKETLKYGEGGYSVYPTEFTGGETEFEVTYKTSTVKVALDSVVEYKVTIDPNGGEFDEDYLTYLAGLNLHNYAIDETTKVITFTYYNNLNGEVLLPTYEEVSKTDCLFTSWGLEETSITNFTRANVNAVANWQTGLVDVRSVEMVEEEGTPYLIINGYFLAAEEVYLYLYEGNAQIELKGDTYTGKPGDEFRVKFDLTRLSAQGDTYEGKWMDIRFNANYKGKDESMEISIAAGSGVQVNTTQKVSGGGYRFLFANWNNWLKVYFQTATFDYALEGITEGNADYLKFTGRVFDSQYFGKYAAVSFWTSSETEFYGGAIDASGNFTLKFDLSNCAANQDTYAHFTIFEDETMAQTLYGGTSTNVKISDVSNSVIGKAALGNSTQFNYYFSFYGASGLSYYVGYRWDGLMVRAVDESFKMSEAHLELDNNKVYYVLTGILKNQTEVKAGYYFQHNTDLDRIGNYDEVYNDTELGITITVGGDGKFEVKCPVSEVVANQFTTDDLWVLTPKIHLFDNEESNLIEIKPESISKETITLNGVRYSLLMNSGTWEMAALVLERVVA